MAEPTDNVIQLDGQIDAGTPRTCEHKRGTYCQDCGTYPSFREHVVITTTESSEATLVTKADK